MKTNYIKAFSLGLVTLLLSLSATNWAADVTPSVTLTSYYSAANGKKADALRTALQGIIDDHTIVGYKSLGTLMQYSDTEEANGKDVVDIYTTCTFTVSGALTWASSGSVGDGMNREHTVPQSWFSEASPMVSDAFHIYPTDCKANNNRSSYLYGEFTGTGTSYSSSKCSESGKLSSSGTKSIASYTVNGKTYTPTATYSGQVYEPVDEYKGDIARGYFYMATRYADKCSSWSGGAFGSDNNGFTNYTAELMLKWHRQDPVSRKELIRNEVIYGNSTYNKSSLKQGNRNPFIDYPELVEYIWGDKKDQNVNISDLTSGYDEAGTGTPTATYNVTLYRMGAVQVLTGKSGTFVLPTDATEANACGEWKFAGWVTTAVSTATTDKPTFVTQVTGASTLYAVYANSGSGAPIRKANATVGTTLWAEDFSGFSANDVPNTSYSDSHSGTTVYSGSVTYSVTNGGGTTKVYNENSGGGTAPEILIAQSNGTLSISGIPTGGATEMSLTFVSNKTSFSVTTESTELDISGSQKSWTISVKSGQTTPATFDLTIKNTGNKNARVDNIVLKVTTAGSDSGSGGGGTPTTYDSDPDDCHCTGNLPQPSVTAEPSDGTLTLTWDNDANATNGYTVTIGKGVGYTTECADPEIGAVTLSGSTNTCVITGLVNDLEYTASVVANATATTCESTAGTATETPVGCESWSDPTVTYGSYSLTAGGSKTAAPTITGTKYGTATYKSSDEAVLQVDGTGRVTPVSAGTATVTVHWTGDATHCPKDVTTSLFTVTGLVRITFDANDGSATPATATQDVTYNVATSLTSISTIGFSRTGYTFQGWSTDKNATSATYTDGASITITAASTLYAVWQVNKHKVTFSQPDNGGTFTVNSSSSSPVNNVDYLSTVTIAITPTNSHFTVNTVTVSGGVSVSGSGNTRTFLMPDNDVTVEVTMTEETKYTVNWYVNNIPTAETNYAGEALAGIGTPSIDCNDKVFQGWTATANYSSDDTAPTDIFTNASTKTMPSNNTTKYYAVFAEVTDATATATFDPATASGLTESPSKTWTHTATGVAMQLVGSSSHYTSGTPNTWTMSHSSGSKTVITSPTNITQIVVRSVYQYTSGNKTYNGWINDASVGTLSPTTFTSAESDGYVTQTISNINAKSVTIQDNYSSAGNQARVVLLTVTCGSTTYTGYTTSCTAPTEVTVIFNANGGTGTMSDQVVDYNEATALTANTFTRTGYSFAGWATTADGSKAYDDQGSVTLTKNTTLYALWTKNNYSVTFSTPTGASAVTVNGQSISPQSVEFGTTVTVAVTPAITHTIGSVSAGSAVVTDNGDNTYTFTMPASDVTISVTMNAKPTYTVRFFDSGTKIFDQQVVEGNTFTKPSNPAGCEGYEFQGWWASELGTDNTTSYIWLNSFGAVYSNQTYHAVFKHVDGGSGGTEGEYTLKNGDESGSFTIVSGVTGEFEQNDGQNPPVWNTNAVRAYSKNSLTITSSVGNLTSISFTFASGEGSNSITASTGTYSSGSWSGDASSVTFTIGGASGHRRFQTIAVGGSGTTYYTTETDCRTCSEPTITFDVVTVNKFDGDAPFKITPNVTGNTMGVTVSYSSSNPSKAEVSADGTVTIHDAMSTDPITITATLEKVDDGVNCQKKVSASYTLNIYNKVTWLVNGSEYTTGDPTSQTTEGGQITTYPTDPDGSTVCGGKTFMGWTTAEYEESDTPPTPLYTGLSTMSSMYITQSTTYYAVFAEESTSEGGSGSGETSKTTSIAVGDIVYLVYESGSYELSGISTTSTKYGIGTSYTTTPAGLYPLEVVAGNAEGSVAFKNGSVYLNLGGNNNSLSTASSVTDNSSWKVTFSDGNAVITNVATSTRTIRWNNASNSLRFACYENNGQQPVQLYKAGGGGSVTTYSAYSTTCGLCMPKPEITSTIIKSDKVTITWKAVTDATGYEFICSGGTVKVAGTTATITGLTPLSDYTYSVRAKGGEPYTCFRTTNGSFSTPDCDDVPYDITVTPYNVVQAIIRWKAEAERAKVVVYKDEACTQIHANIADTISPCYVSGLAENTRYWFKVFGGASQDCESPVQTFLTQTTAVELVEWRDTAIVILLTGDETTASVLIEDKNDNATNVETNVANNLFFSKYYEASGNVKLWAVYNGTAAKISLEKVKVQVSSNGAQWGYVNGSPNANATTSLASFGHKETGYIYPGEEIIVYNGGSSTDDGKVIECMAGKYGSGYNTNPDSLWYLVKNNTTSFSGDDGLLLLNGTDTLDIIGGLDYAAAYDSASTYPGWGDGYGWNCDDGTDVEGKPMKLSTNRCILVRKNTVKDGMNAVAKNKTDFVTLCEEWWGSSVPKSDNSQEEIDSSCDNFSYVGHYDYQDYYASFEPVDTIENLTKNDDGTITIPIPGLDTMSCSMLRVNVYDTLTGDLKASREYRVPIIIQKGEVKSTNKLFTKHGVAVCKECDVLVYSGAKLIKDNVGENRDTIGNLTLYPGSTLELPDGKGAYHVKSLTYRVEGDSVPVTKLSATDHLYTETQRLVVSRRIKNDRYYFISFPYDVNVNEITLANGSKAVNGKDFRLMEYDAEARATEGSLQGAPGHWKLFSGSKLLAGRGYAIAVNTKAMKEILFPMTIPSKNLTYEERNKQTNTVDINEYVGDARNTNHNWNLIAHPYITKFEVTEGAANVEAYWENPSRENTNWIDDWQTWTEDNPTQPTDSTSTQPTDTTHTQQPDTTTTHDVNIIMEGTLECGIVWVLYEDGSIELTGGGQMPDFTSLDAVPWAQHRQHIKNVKIGGEVQKIGQYAFSQCTNLMTVTIVAPVTNLASYAFAGCTQLRNFRIETTEYVSATNATFNNISSLTMISLQVPQSMYDQYSAKTPWNKMAISAFDENSNTGGAPRRAPVHDGWTESQGGVYITIPYAEGGKVLYRQQWIDDVTDIPPFTAVFIQGDGRGEMTFNMYPSGGGAPKRSKNADRYETRDHTVLVGLAINGNGQQDMTSLRLRPDFGEHYKFNLDLLKFTTFNTARPQIYIKTENDQLAFRAISDSLAANTWIPVGVYCRDAGTYTFSMYDRYVWDEVEAVYLRDNVTGAETNLLMGNYTITTTGQIYTNTRFAVKVLLRRKVKDTPTMIDHTEDPNAPRKFFRDGLLYIMRDGKVYDLTGKPVQFDDLLNR